MLLLLPIVLMLPLLRGADRWGLAAVTLAWCDVVAVGTRAHSDSGQSVLFPLAIFETFNFLQPRPMPLWMLEPAISAHTIKVLTQHQPIAAYLAFYDLDYWDSLTFNADGPKVKDLPESVLHEFFTYNLWHKSRTS